MSKKEELNTLSIVDLLKPKARLLLLISEKSKRKGYVDFDAIMEDCEEVFAEDYKDDRSFKSRMTQMITELTEEKMIVIDQQKKNEKHIVLNVEIKHQIIKTERIFFKWSMLFVTILSWTFFVLSFWSRDVLVISLLFAEALVITANYFNYELRPVLSLKETREQHQDTKTD